MSSLTESSSLTAQCDAFAYHNVAIVTRSHSGDGVKRPYSRLFYCLWGILHLLAPETLHWSIATYPQQKRETGFRQTPIMKENHCFKLYTLGIFWCPAIDKKKKRHRQGTKLRCFLLHVERKGTTCMHAFSEGRALVLSWLHRSGSFFLSPPGLAILLSEGLHVFLVNQFEGYPERPLPSLGNLSYLRTCATRDQCLPALVLLAHKSDTSGIRKLIWLLKNILASGLVRAHQGTHTLGDLFFITVSQSSAPSWNPQVRDSHERQGVPVQKGPSSSGLPAGSNAVCTQGVSREEDEWSGGNPEKSQLWLYAEPGALLTVMVSVFLPSLCRLIPSPFSCLQ